MPLIVPPEERVNPVGKEPEERLQLYGAVPPVACKVAEYALPAVPLARVVVVICGGMLATTVRVKSAE